MIVTDAPTGPVVGANEVTFGVGITLKLALLVAVPAGVVMLILPLVAPIGTVALIELDDTNLNDAFRPLNFTAVAPLNRLPVIATDVPAPPLFGENDPITGRAETAATPLGNATTARPTPHPSTATRTRQTLHRTPPTTTTR